jgi:hypothetical protein
MANSALLLRGILRGLRPFAWAALGSAVAASGQTLVADSPFGPSGTAGAAAAGPAEAYELAGSSVEGSEVSVCIFERQAKRSEWIPVGGISNGVHVISFDPAHDRAVVTIGGARKELSLRKSTVAAMNGTTAPAAPAALAAAPAYVPPAPAEVEPAAPPTVASNARDQREARMLVSDLLEIGAQQRKAYQEAKQKAAATTPAQPSN